MKKGFMTIKQASAHTGKHPDTIRALVRKNRDTDHISSDDKGRVLISSKLLAQTYKTTSPEPLEQLDIEKELQRVTSDKKSSHNATEQATQPNPEHSDLLKALTDQLKAKDQQIAELTKTVSQALDQQQQLSGLLLQAGNNPTSSDQPNTPEDHQSHTRVRVKKRRWFSRKK